MNNTKDICPNCIHETYAIVISTKETKPFSKGVIIMLHNETMNLTPENNDFLIYHGHKNLENDYLNALNSDTKHITAIMNTSNFNTITKQSRELYKTVAAIVKDFDRHFDNTVLDTFSFDKIMNSEKIIDTIYYYSCISNLNHHELIEVKEAIASYVMNEVDKSYQNSYHFVFQPHLYTEYITELFYRIYFRLNTH